MVFESSSNLLLQTTAKFGKKKKKIKNSTFSKQMVQTNNQLGAMLGTEQLIKNTDAITCIIAINITRRKEQL